jgi:hypothetical protein
MIDLKQLMEERSANPPAQADLRYPQIRRRVTTRKRRRVALVATVVAVALTIAGGYAALPRQRVSPDVIASPSLSKAQPDGFPPYAFGRKLVHSATEPISSGQVVLTWTPTTPGFYFSNLCSGVPEGVFVRGALFLNGNLVQPSALCGSRNSFQPARSDEWMANGWIRAGEAITLIFAAERANLQGLEASPAPMPTGGTMALAIYVPVPFEEYRLPPRPAHLPPLANWTDCPPEHLVAGDPREPLRPVTFTTQWRDRLLLRWDTQTPGLLHFAIDGVTVATLGWWDYGGPNWSRTWNTAHAPDWAGIQGWKWPAQGAQVTITFTPEHFTGGWKASLSHLGEFDDPKPCG